LWVFVPLQVGLALTVPAAQCIFTMSDKQSRKTAVILKDWGAGVIVCPTSGGDDPRSHYSIARKLNAEIEETRTTTSTITPQHLSPLRNHEDLKSGPRPKVKSRTSWRGTGGGTINGTGEHLKRQNPAIVSVGLNL
jgi:cystathionine beta-synthase